MKVWLVEFTSYGFGLDAVVVARSWSEAITLLRLGPDSKLVGEPKEIGDATGDLTPRVVTEDKLA